MASQRWDGASFQDLLTAKRWDGASWVDLTLARRWDGVQWVDIWTTFLGTGGGDTLSITGNWSSFTEQFGCNDPEFPPLVCPFAVNLTSRTVTVNVTGGSEADPPATLLWERLAGSDTQVVVSNATGASVTFTKSDLARGQLVGATWRCTATRGSQTATFTVVTMFEYVYTRDGQAPV